MSQPLAVASAGGTLISRTGARYRRRSLLAMRSAGGHTPRHMKPRGRLLPSRDNADSVLRWAVGVIAGELLVRVLDPWLTLAADLIRRLLGI